LEYAPKEKSSTRSWAKILADGERLLVIIREEKRSLNPCDLPVFVEKEEPANVGNSVKERRGEDIGTKEKDVL